MFSKLRTFRCLAFSSLPATELCMDGGIHRRHCPYPAERDVLLSPSGMAAFSTAHTLTTSFHLLITISILLSIKTLFSNLIRRLEVTIVFQSSSKNLSFRIEAQRVSLIGSSQHHLSALAANLVLLYVFITFRRKIWNSVLSRNWIYFLKPASFCGWCDFVR